jgi:cytochrome P450
VGLAAAPGDVTDLLGPYARPLPIAVLCELLGIPAASWHIRWKTIRTCHIN